ncbi:farnesyl diphosphate synthase [Metallibacterium scheffleri]
MNPTHLELGPAFVALIRRSEAALERALPPAHPGPGRLQQAMRYAALGSGKRLRPLLTYATGVLLQAPLARLDAPAAAAELIHAYSLIHDDLPAMDDDDLRRGRPTCHVAFGEATAILAGDALQALAFDHLAHDAALDVDADTRLAMLCTLATACGAEGMAGGQALDLDATGGDLDVPALEHLHALKTGALIRACVRMSALAAAADAATLHALDDYAAAFGLAFQIRDDLLDVEGATATLGKTAGKDSRQGKPTFPTLLGVDGARRRLHEVTTQALQALAPFDARADLLRELAQHAAARAR